MPCVYGAPKYVSHVSRWASKWISATGPWRSCTARSTGNATVWSPPSTTGIAASAKSDRVPASICAIASSIANGVQAMSPASATCWSANGRTSNPAW